MNEICATFSFQKHADPAGGANIMPLVVIFDVCLLLLYLHRLLLYCCCLLSYLLLLLRGTTAGCFRQFLAPRSDPNLILGAIRRQLFHHRGAGRKNVVEFQGERKREKPPNRCGVLVQTIYVVYLHPATQRSGVLCTYGSTLSQQ